MGWGAAYHFYLENKSWLDSPEEAYDVLYGPEKKETKQRKRNACSVCGKHFGSKQAVMQHERDKHGA